MRTAVTAARDTWKPELLAAVAIWIVATVVVVLVAPIVVGWPLPVAVVVVLGACATLGTTITGWLRGAGLLAATHGGLRLGAAVAVVGQLLDVVLVVGLGGRYPGLSVDDTGRLTLALLGGYAAFVVGATLFDHAGRRR